MDKGRDLELFPESVVLHPSSCQAEFVALVHPEQRTDRCKNDAVFGSTSHRTPAVLLVREEVADNRRFDSRQVLVFVLGGVIWREQRVHGGIVEGMGG